MAVSVSILDIYPKLTFSLTEAIVATPVALDHHEPWKKPVQVLTNVTYHIVSGNLPSTDESLIIM